MWWTMRWRWQAFALRMRIAIWRLLIRLKLVETL